MRKYICSIYHFITLLLFSGAFFAFTFGYVYFLIRTYVSLVPDELPFFAWAVSGFFLLGMMIIAWKRIIPWFDDPLYGWFSFDDEKIEFYSLNRKKVEIRYDECVEMGICYWVHPKYYTTIVYFTKTKLSYSQRKNLANDRNTVDSPKYVKEFVIFEYRPSVYKDLWKHLPDNLRQNAVHLRKEYYL